MIDTGMGTFIRCGLKIFAIATATVSPLLLSADDRTRAPKVLDSDQNLQAFDHVWRTVRDKHWDESLGGLDWNAIKDEFRPQAEAAKDSDALDAVLNTMLGRLKQSHFGIIPERAYQSVLTVSEQDSESNDAVDRGTIGITFRLVDELPMVWQLNESSSAYEAGIRPGWILTHIEGNPVADLLHKASQVSDSWVEPDFIKRLLVLQFSTGTMGKTRRYSWRDAQDHPVDTELAMRRPFGVESTFGNLPTAYVDCRSCLTHEGVPVFSLNLFFEPTLVLDRFESIVRDNPHAPGLILDLRGNIGGLGFMAMAMGGWLTDRTGSQLGTMTTRSGSLKFAIVPRDTVFRGKVAVLVDEYSMSTSEILAGGLQDNGLARVFGRKTPGMALPSIIEKLPYGAGFQYAYTNYQSVDGKPLEGFGVVPDETIALRREDALNNCVADVAAAVHWILEK